MGDQKKFPSGEIHNIDKPSGYPGGFPGTAAYRKLYVMPLMVAETRDFTGNHQKPVAILLGVGLNRIRIALFLHYVQFQSLELHLGCLWMR